jgi:hypothetical protein
MCGSIADMFELTELPDDFLLLNSDGTSSIVSAIFGVFGKILHGAGISEK